MNELKAGLILGSFVGANIVGITTIAKYIGKQKNIVRLSFIIMHIEEELN